MSAARGPKFDLAVCAEMVFVDLPFAERVRRIDDLGFAVEIWEWQDKDIDALVATGASFSSMTGYSGGSLIEEDADGTLLARAERAAEAAAKLGCPRLVVHPARLVEGRVAEPKFRATGEMWLNARRNLEKLAELGEAVDSPHARMMLDLYHAQIGEGNLVALVERAGEAIGEVQVADVPGRCEPGTGEVYYPAVARALERIGYTGTVGLEAFASGDDVEALERFRAAFV